MTMYVASHMQYAVVMPTQGVKMLFIDIYNLEACCSTI